jgi:outer membrane lipoprotein-sorting protein
MAAMAAKSPLRRLALALAFALILPSIAIARPAVPARLSEQDQADLQRIERYLNEIRTLTSPFQQVSSDGTQARGQVALMRPGKIRIDYGEPNGLLVVGGGGSMTIYDRALRQANNIRTDQTPIGLLVRDQIRLSGDVTVTRFERGPNIIRVTFSKTTDASSGRVTLVFDERPLQLRQWTVVDSQNIETRVALLDPKQGVTLDPKLFEFIPPEKGGRGSGRE